MFALSVSTNGRAPHVKAVDWEIPLFDKPFDYIAGFFDIIVCDFPKNNAVSDETMEEMKKKMLDFDNICFCKGQIIVRSESQVFVFYFNKSCDDIKKMEAEVKKALDSNSDTNPFRFCRCKKEAPKKNI